MSDGPRFYNSVVSFYSMLTKSKGLLHTSEKVISTMLEDPAVPTVGSAYWYLQLYSLGKCCSLTPIQHSAWNL